MRWTLLGAFLLLGAVVALGSRHVLGPPADGPGPGNRANPGRDAAGGDETLRLEGRPPGVEDPPAGSAPGGRHEAPGGPADPLGSPADLVLVEATTDRDLYEAGEPVRIRRVFENRSDRPVRMDAAGWGHRAHAEIVLSNERGSGLREPSTRDVPEVMVAPGERVVNELVIEIPAPGPWTVEIPPAYLTRGSRRPAFRLPLTVVDRADPVALAAKVERLGRAIATEDPSCPTCWSEAQKDLERLGDPVVPHLGRWLRTSEVPHLRAVAAKLLGPKVRAGAVGSEDLLAGLTDPVASVRTMCVTALAGSADRDVTDALLLRLGDADPWVRLAAIQAVATCDDPRAEPALAERLGDAAALVRIQAAVELAERRGSVAGIRVLVEALAADPALNASLVVGALEKLAGITFGRAEMPGLHSDLDDARDAVRANETLAERWLAWWESEGRARFR